MASINGETELFGFFAGDHNDCDMKWVEVEALLDGDNGAALGEAWQAFDQAMRRHFAMEEDVMFPAFEAASGMGQGGPTVVMREEHQQMRTLLDQIGFAIAEGDNEEALDLGDTLHMLIQQHNVKEEGMLYPMAENVLAADWTELQQTLKQY